MKRILLVLTVALMMAVMLVAMAAPAMAISNMGQCQKTTHQFGAYQGRACND